MPHISVKMLKGRSEEQKQRLAAALTETLKNTLGAPDMYVSLSIEDFSGEEWQDVFKQEITDKPDCLYKKPKYDPKSLI